MPAKVISKEPMTWAVMVPQAQPRRPCCSSPVTSAEKLEKVVRPPQKPVITSSRHSGDSVVQLEKKAISAAMEATQGNKVAAARMLGLSRAKLSERLEIPV